MKVNELEAIMNNIGFECEDDEDRPIPVKKIKRVFSEEVVWKYREGSSYQLIVREYGLYDFEDEIPEYLEDNITHMEIVWQGVNLWGSPYQMIFATYNQIPMRKTIVDMTVKALAEHLERQDVCLNCFGRMFYVSGWGDYDCHCRH